MIARLVLSGFLSFAASTVPDWRIDPSAPRHGVTLVVGGPVLPFTPRPQQHPGDVID